jgi:hypothetical protein
MLPCYHRLAVERAAFAVRWANPPLGCPFFIYMFLLYLDDAGSEANSSEEYFVLAGVAAFEAQTSWLTQEAG